MKSKRIKFGQEQGDQIVRTFAWLADGSGTQRISLKITEVTQMLVPSFSSVKVMHYF
jgi:hypothetical protein